MALGRPVQGPPGTSAIQRITLFVESSEVITTGVKQAMVVCPVNGSINRWIIGSDISTSAVVTIRNNGVAISGTAKPTLSSSTYASSTTLTGWDALIETGDVFTLSVDSNTAAKYITVIMDVTL